MNDDSLKQHRLVDARVERWTAEAKRLLAAGDETLALELYRRAADDLPGAPWLQHRTAELARKLEQPELAIVYFRRAATAFQIADFSKRAVAPLRTAWLLAITGLPSTSRSLVELATDLVQLHRRLGHAADASVIFERTNSALRARGFSELGADVLSPTRGARGPSSEVVPRGSGSPPAEPSLHRSSNLPRR